MGDSSAFWMPFSANRAFKERPRLLEKSSGIYYTSEDGREVLDGTSGLWCVNAGHGRKSIIDAMSKQMNEMVYCPPFQIATESSFTLANTLTALAPDPINHAFFTSSGSEAVDSAMKIALAYWHSKGQTKKTGFVSRDKDYHGVGFGGTSLSGLPANRKQFGNLLHQIDFLPHTYPENIRFNQGLLPYDTSLADNLEDIFASRGADTIAAVMIEPIAGSAGVIVPPEGHLQRLREICTAHDVLLIFDEVITAFGRIGSPFASIEFSVTPDMIVCAKGLTSGYAPMGAVLIAEDIYETVIVNSEMPIELFHGYTYSAHPVSVAAAQACIDVYQNENLLDSGRPIFAYWQQAIHGLKDCKYVIDIRNYGLMAAIDIESSAAGPGKRSYEIFVKAFFECGMLIRVTGDTIALSPPLIITESQIDTLIEKVKRAIELTD